MSFSSYLTYLFPLAAIAFVFLTASGWLPVLKREHVLEESEEAPPRPRLTFSAPRHAVTRRDRIAALIITAAYAAVAFWELGDTRAPQSFCRFEERGRYADIALPAETDISSVVYYCGLYTGNYYLQFSDDGKNYTDVSVMKQEYSDLFKWKTAEFNEGADTEAKYIRIIADGELSLGELALYGGDGGLIDAANLSYDAGCAQLFDEQDLVPASSTYMNSTYFDEIYHARTAFENIEGVYPYEISHPPLGKLILSVGIRLFGMTPFGWRFMGTAFGVLMLPVLYIFLKRLFGSTSIAVSGTLIFAFDFMHFVQTRIATIDTYAVFFILLMYLFMWRFVSGGKTRDLALSGLFFGIGAACKWTCIYAGGGLAVIWAVYWFTRRKEEGFWLSFAQNALSCILYFIIIPGAIYYASYWPYGEAKGLSGIGMYFTKDYAKIVLDNQKYMFDYHSGLVATHPYSARWYQWIVDARPILYYLEYFDNGTKSVIGAFLSPLLCWGGLLAVFGTVWLAFGKRDGKAMFILIGFLAQLLPWVAVSRITFEYHYFPSAVFLTLALCHMWSRCAEAGLSRWRKEMVAFTAVSVVLFAAFYPVLSGATVADWYSTYILRWLPSWPF